MMESLRIVGGIGFFLGGITLIWDAVQQSPVSWVLLGLAVACFLLAYWVWPSRRKGQRESDSAWLDVIEFVVEWPVELLVWLIRGLGRLVSGRDGGIDLDF